MKQRSKNRNRRREQERKKGRKEKTTRKTKQNKTKQNNNNNKNRANKKRKQLKSLLTSLLTGWLVFLFFLLRHLKITKAATTIRSKPTPTEDHIILDRLSEVGVPSAEGNTIGINVNA